MLILNFYKIIQLSRQHIIERYFSDPLLLLGYKKCKFFN